MNFRICTGRLMKPVKPPRVVRYLLVLSLPGRTVRCSRPLETALWGHDPTGHAELIAIREAARKFGSERLEGCDIYVTLEPCAMCAQAIAFARLRRLYFGAEDSKGGGVTVGARIFSQSTTHHRPEIYGGICEAEAAQLLRDFFRKRR